MLARADGRRSVVIEAEPGELAGVNSRGELALLEGEWQRRRRAQAMADGVTLVAPETVWFAHDTEIGRDTVVEPNVVFGPGVRIGERATIRAFSHLEGAEVSAGAEIGPYARLRPGAEIGEGAKVGNFVEVKKRGWARAPRPTTCPISAMPRSARRRTSAPAPSPAIMTASASTDGDRRGAFIGSNSALVAPVTIGAGAIVGAGAVVTKDVAPDALALVRPPQRQVEAGRPNSESRRKAPRRLELIS
jgi:bifunctional UDP-N-acetylglucosamine pyrophosphorylase/glucosamine-1-phosphate N-acetyltransferase